MYTLAVRREFIARHQLIGGDWGPENRPNSHRYVIELQLVGKELNGDGFLLDIVDVQRHLTEVLDYFNEKMLNDLPEFHGLNPSLENFARIITVSIAARIRAETLQPPRIVLWESDSAWASYAAERPPT